jgi:transcriptional regulator with XRE-family HTH domain
VSTLQDDVVSIGADVRRVRTERGMTQAELASLVGMRQPAIVRIEQGQNVPTWRTLEKIANALGVRVNVSFGDSATEK